MLNDRKRKILQIIIEDYIETAEPVGSRTIARKHNLGLSPATIRNEMSDLELLGYLEQPHTGVLTENDRALINSWYKERIRNMDDIFKSTAKILSRMTQNVSLVLANKKSTARFKYLKFLPLSDTQAIMCIVTDDGAMDNGLIDIPAGMSSAEMDYLSGKMSNLLEGRRLTEITGDLLQEVYSAVSEDEVMLASLKKAISNIVARREEQRAESVPWRRQAAAEPAGIPGCGQGEKPVGYPGRGKSGEGYSERRG